MPGTQPMIIKMPTTRTLFRVHFPDGVRYVIQDGNEVLAIHPPLDQPVVPGKDREYRQRAQVMMGFASLYMGKYKGFAEKGPEGILFGDLLWRNGDALEIYERLLELEGEVRQAAWREFMKERYGKYYPHYQRVRDAEALPGTGDSQDGSLFESGKECPD